MKRVAILFILLSQNAFAQGAVPGVETEFFRSITGVSITLGLLVILVAASFVFLFGLRKEAKQEAKDDRAAKDAVFQQIPQLARDMSKAFEQATQAVKDSEKEQSLMHQQNLAAIKAVEGKLDALSIRLDNLLQHGAVR